MDVCLIGLRWDILLDELHQRDQSLIRQGETQDVTGTSAKITRSSPFYVFINVDFASSETATDPHVEEILGRLGERILFLMSHQWQALQILMINRL